MHPYVLFQLQLEFKTITTKNEMMEKMKTEKEVHNALLVIEIKESIWIFADDESKHPKETPDWKFFRQSDNLVFV